MSQKKDISDAVIGLNTREVVLLLYLLHHPSHPYYVAKEFDKAMRSELWKIAKTKALGRPRKLYSICSNLVKRGLLLKGERQDKRGRAPYYLNHNLLFEIAEHRTCILETYDHIYGDESLEEIHTNTIEDCFKAINLLSRSPNSCIAKINGTTNFDIATLLSYIDGLLAEIEEFIHKWEPLLDYETGQIKRDEPAWERFIKNSTLNWEGWLVKQRERILAEKTRNKYGSYQRNAWSVEGLHALQSYVFYWDMLHLDMSDFYDASVAVSDIRKWVGEILSNIIKLQQGSQDV